MTNENLRQVIPLLRRRWIGQGIEPRLGLDKEKIERVEAEKGITLPEHIRSFYQEFDGMKEMDREDLVRIWPLDECIVGKYSGIPRTSVCWQFADYSIEAHGYFVAMELNGSRHQIYADYGRKNEMLFSDFREFLWSYVQGTLL